MEETLCIKYGCYVGLPTRKQKRGIQMNTTKLIYVAHPYGGAQKNVTEAKELVKKFAAFTPQCFFITPLTAMLREYKEETYDRDMELCLKLLNRCDALILTGEWKTSQGCVLEYDHARKLHIPIYQFSAETGLALRLVKSLVFMPTKRSRGNIPHLVKAKDSFIALCEPAKELNGSDSDAGK